MSGPTTSRSIRFGGLRIEYDDRVLTPRSWTEAQARWAADLAASAPPGPLLELCSGAGQIGLLAATLSSRSLICVDADRVACEFSARNATAARVAVNVRHGPMDGVLGHLEEFAVIIADPPWVPTQGVQRFPEDPVSAIDGGTDGLDLIGTCLAVIAEHLSPDGAAVLQVGPERQSSEVAGLLAGHPSLGIREVREFDRGALLHLGHPASTASS